MRRFVATIAVCVWSVYMLALAFPARAGVLDDLKQEIQQKEEEIRQLETDKKKFGQTITEKQKAQRTLKSQITTLTAQITQLEAQLRLTGARVERTELNIRSLTLRITETQAHMSLLKERIAGTLRILNEDAATHRTLFALVLRAQPLSSFLSQLAYTTTLEEGLYQRHQELVAERDMLQGQEQELKDTKGELLELKGRLAAEREAKDAQQDQKTSLLKATKNEEVKYKQLLTETEKRRQDILRDIKELEDKLRHTIDPASLPVPRPGVINWPVQGIVSQEYGNTKDTGFTNDAYGFHNGIDIAGETGTPIRAARDGVIKAIGNNSPYAYGKWIAVEHDNNLTTLYAHLSGYAGFKQGSTVRKGQVVGYMGATGFATGPHLHFTVYASNTFLTEQRWFGLLPLGGSINPRNYLP